MSIKRYEDEIYGPSSYDFEESESGSWVKYVDHAAEVARLNEQVRALSVAYERMTYVLINEGIQVPDPKPAEVDTFLNEVRAQGVDMHAEHLTRKAIESGENKNHAYAYLAANFAARIRAGEVPNA